ncbi:MAG: pyridoxamine 5'-phosphate oxidase family protein [Deltaproteobacteria bacterium]|nr:pyridoxamine 5'-phosphate oxidase family protein [Deltaproteobacteria bacterium]
MSQKKEISAPDLEQEIITFLSDRATQSGGKHTEPGCNLVHGYACVLATCHDNMPRATPVDFFCDGSLSIWINAEPGGKVANIMRNPNVSVGIYERVDHRVEQKSMQLWGTAEIINLSNNPDVFEQKWITFGLDEAMAGILEDNMKKGLMPEGPTDKIVPVIRKKINMIKIKPTKIALLCMQPNSMPIKKFWENGKAYINELKA